MNYVISLGGSIINPGKINVKLLKAFGDLILTFSKKGHRFFIVTGGGQPARDAQAAAKSVSKITPDDLDWIGIAATKVNAELLRSIFGKAGYKRIISDPSKKVGGLKRINIFSGWKPGWSTDFVAVKVAQTYDAKTVINLSNIDYVYDRDPRKHKNARKFERLTWEEFNKLFSSKWNPGANVPFDPVAAKLAQQHGIKVIIMNGWELKNLQNFVRNNAAAGTVIE
ncbi:MAG: UMP kinase [bacterium]|nr:UMP kinase [bacterium]